ncbi:MAG TPA: hypothetical protein DF613_05060 [Lachnospiraceae bacterium]|nr:hypothetical protein [Lachnospiraceae bacterium]
MIVSGWRILVFLLLAAGLIALQIFLSKRENRWPGLVLPIIAFLFSLLYPLNMVTPSGGVTAGFIVQMIIVWLEGNIPTFVFLAIYFGCRGKQRRNKQLDKMNIQDLT